MFSAKELRSALVAWLIVATVVVVFGTQAQNTESQNSNRARRTGTAEPTPTPPVKPDDETLRSEDVVRVRINKKRWMRIMDEGAMSLSQ